MKYITISLAFALLFFNESAIAQRRNLSYDSKYPKGHTERRVVGKVYSPVESSRQETCRQLAGAKYNADVETVKSGNFWVCREILR